MLANSHGWRLAPLSVVLLAVAGCQDSPAPFDVDGPSYSSGQTKSAVCHYSADTGTFHKITIADPGLPAHIEHGDFMPGEPFPDGSGYLNDDCVPMRYVLGSPPNNTGVYGGPTGTAGTVSCPAGAVAIAIEGFSGYYDWHDAWKYWIGQVRLSCATLRGDGGLGASSFTSYFGDGAGFTTGTTPLGVTCLPGRMLVGGPGEYATYVSRIGANCASLLRIADSVGGHDISFGPFGTAIVADPARSRDNVGIPFTAACDPGYVATGITGRYGALVDAVGFVCTPLLRQPL
jgi:hypothetical protein